MTRMQEIAIMLSGDEMRLLHKVNAACPVFTHGRALEMIGGNALNA